MRISGLAAACAICFGNPLVAQELRSYEVVPDPETLFDHFVEDHGVDFEACFAPIPELLPPPDAVGFEGAPPEVPARLVIAVDGSGSMAGKVGGVVKMEAARSAARAFLDALPDAVDVGMIAFGHLGGNDESQRAESCAGVETLVEPGAGREAIHDSLRSITATGWTPLADAIEAAGMALEPFEDGLQVVYVVSDGRETCGGDPVAAARKLHDGDMQAIVNIIGFDLDQDDRAELQAVADAGGGVFDEVGVNEAEARVREWANLALRVKTESDVIRRIRDNSLDISVAIRDMGNCVSFGVREEQNAWNRALRTADGEMRDSFADTRPSYMARHDAVRARNARVRTAMRALSDASLQEMGAALEDLQEAFEAVSD